MSSALEEFRAQRALVQEVQAQLVEAASLLRALHEEASQLAQDQNLHALLKDEQTWLTRAEVLVRDVRAFREFEVSRHRRAAWRRWVAAVVFSLSAAAACGAGYVWAARPYEAELTSLRQRADLFDLVAQRVMTMTPAERRQFDALMKWPERRQR